MHPYSQYLNPYLGNRLNKLKMDKEFIRGEGCWLFDSNGHKYLDMIAAYGALPFGHNPPEIWKAIRRVGDLQEPNMIQPSALKAAGELARQLVQLAPPGLTLATFANSGAEAAEAGIKLSRAATGRLGILATLNSFHGKTLGALSATGKVSYQKAFGAPVEHFHFVPYGDYDAVEQVFKSHPDYFAAIIVEPIQGEGGIVVPPAGYLQQLRSLCTQHGVLLILDEIQSGLGRTGKLFACEAEDVRPDILLLAKALGGGLVPIGAILCTDDVYNEEFALKHSSTFAGNTLAARVALASLELLHANDSALIRNAAQQGDFLKNGLLKLQARFPQIIKEIRGRGLMLGLDFHLDRTAYPGKITGIMAEQELLAPLASSYLLNQSGIRVAPTLNGASVLRIEPPLIVNEAQCTLTLEAFDYLMQTLNSGNTARLLGHLINKQVNPTKTKPPVYPPLPTPEATSEEARFAFLIHPVEIQNYSQFDASLSGFSKQELLDLASKWNDLVSPFVISGVHLVSASGKKAYGEFITVPRTAQELLTLPPNQALNEIKEAIQLGISRGARLVGLGAYTSVITKAGRSVLEEGCAITTGNSYTVAASTEALLEAARKLDFVLAQSTVAVVGASGSIGRASSILLSEEVGHLILIGNPKWPLQSRRRLLKVAGDIVYHLLQYLRLGRHISPGSMGDQIQKHPLFPGLDASFEACLSFAQALEERHEILSISSNLDTDIQNANLILSATSSPLTLLTPENLHWGALVCDISRPGNISPDIRDVRPDVLVIDGGIIEVPGRPDLGWDFGFESGLSYSCMAETMILALEQHYEHTSIGSDLNLPTILRLRELAALHGFKVADFRSFNHPLPEEIWADVLRARKKQLSATS